MIDERWGAAAGFRAADGLVCEYRQEGKCAAFDGAYWNGGCVFINVFIDCANLSRDWICFCESSRGRTFQALIFPG